MQLLMKYYKTNEIIGVLMFSLLFSFCLKDITNNFAYKLLPEEKVTISAQKMKVVEMLLSSTKEMITSCFRN